MKLNEKDINYLADKVYERLLPHFRKIDEALDRLSEKITKDTSIFANKPVDDDFPFSTWEHVPDEYWEKVLDDKIEEIDDEEC